MGAYSEVCRNAQVTAPYIHPFRIEIQIVCYLFQYLGFKLHPLILVPNLGSFCTREYIGLFKHVTDCDAYDKAAVKLHENSSPTSTEEEVGGLTTAQALQLCVLEGRLHRRDIMLFRRLARMITPEKSGPLYVCVGMA